MTRLLEPFPAAARGLVLAALIVLSALAPATLAGDDGANLPPLPAKLAAKAEAHDAAAMYALYKFRLSKAGGHATVHAMQWLRKAAAYGHEDAMLLLGQRYFVGDGVLFNDAASAFWMGRAARAGTHNAQAWLVVRAETGNLEAADALGKLKKAGIDPASDASVKAIVPEMRKRYQSLKRSREAFKQALLSQMSSVQQAKFKVMAVRMREDALRGDRRLVEVAEKETENRGHQEQGKAQQQRDQARQQLSQTLKNEKQVDTFVLAGKQAVAAVAIYLTPATLNEGDKLLKQLEQADSIGRINAILAKLDWHKAGRDWAKQEARAGVLLTDGQKAPLHHIAVKWLDEAARAHALRAITRMAELGRDGRYVKKNRRAAYHLVEYAAARHDPIGLYLRYTANRDRWAPIPMLRLTTPGLRSAAKAGYPPAMADYGYELVLGKNVTKNRPAGLKLLEAAHKANDPRGTLLLGTVIIADDHQRGLKLIRQAADAGYPDAIMTTGLLYLHGAGVKKDTAKGMKLIRQAARDHSMMAEKFLRRRAEGSD